MGSHKCELGKSLQTRATISLILGRDGERTFSFHSDSTLLQHLNAVSE